MITNAERLSKAYAALVERRFDRIPEFFHPAAKYRSSGVFPGIKPEYNGYVEIEELLQLSVEPWEMLEIEVICSRSDEDLVVAQIRFHGVGAGSGIEVNQNAGHLARFRDGRIVELSAFESYEDALAASELASRPAVAG